MQIKSLSKPRTQHLFTLIAMCIEEAEDTGLRETAKKMLEVVPVYQSEVKENEQLTHKSEE